jgi:hypothetical protein
MIYTAVTSLTPEQVFLRAKRFFAERVPNQAAFPDKEGSGFLVLRGQGGEELAISATQEGGVTHVRGSTLLFDQPLERFLSILPQAEVAV